MQQQASSHSQEKKELSRLQSDNIPEQNNTKDVARQKQNSDKNIRPKSEIQKKEGDDHDQPRETENNEQSEITQKRIVQEDKQAQTNPIQESLNLKTETQESHNPTQIRATQQQVQQSQQKIIINIQQKRENQQEQSQDKEQLRQQTYKDNKEKNEHGKQLGQQIETNKMKTALIFREDDPDQVELYKKESKQEECEDKNQKIPEKRTVAVKLPEQKEKKNKNTQAKPEKKKQQIQDKNEKKIIKKENNKKSTTKKKTQNINIIKNQQKPITEEHKSQKKEKSNPKHIEDRGQNKQLKLIHNKSQPQKNDNENDPDIEQKNIQSSILPTTASILHQEPVAQSEIPNDVIIKSAQKQRLTTVYTLLNQYLQIHFKYQQGHEACLINLENQINRKKGMKLLLLYNIREFFTNMFSMCKQFYQQCYKYQYSILQEQPQNDNSNCYNPGINIRKQWNKGFQELIYLRKSVGNDFGKQNQFIQKELVQSLNKMFSAYDLKVSAELQKIIEKKQTYRQKCQQFHKQITKINKVYYKQMEDKKHSDDLFVQIVRFVNIETQLRKLLIKWGKTIVQSRNQYLIHEELLFSDLQKLLNAYRNSNKALFEGGKQQNYFNKVVQLTKQIKSPMEFNILCPITDIDYIKCVQSLDERQKKQMTNRDFTQFIQLLYFKRLVGDASSLLKGITGKQFQLKDKEERIINTIAGNLVRFNKNTCQLKDKFYVKHISAKIVQQGIVEIKEITPGVFFDSQRTVRLTFKDNDRAEEMITFLNAVE